MMTMPPRTHMIKCPLSRCEFTLDATPPESIGHAPAALAEMFGPGVLEATWAHQHSQRVERDLAAHFKTHEIADFLRTITLRTTERDEALAALVALSNEVGR